MLIDFIPVQKLPWVIVWIDWNVYAYWPSLVFSLVVFVGSYLFSGAGQCFSDFSLPFFIGFCAWCVMCAVRYGYSVG